MQSTQKLTHCSEVFVSDSNALWLFKLIFFHCTTPLTPNFSRRHTPETCLSGISQPCNSPRQLHAPFTTCRMEQAEVQRAENTAAIQKVLCVIIKECASFFACVHVYFTVINMAYRAGGSNRLQQVCASQCSPAGFHWAPAQCTHRWRSEVASARMSVLFVCCWQVVLYLAVRENSLDDTFKECDSPVP